MQHLQKQNDKQKQPLPSQLPPNEPQKSGPEKPQQQNNQKQQDFPLVAKREAEQQNQKNELEPYRTYKGSGYHSKEGNAIKSKEPRGGQAALDNSIPFKQKGNTQYQRRLGVSEDEIVVLDQTGILNETGEELYHGHVREWKDLKAKMRVALRETGKVTKKGKITK